MSETILFQQKDGIATLTFNNSSRRNALGVRELDAIEVSLVALSEGTRVLIITSSDDRTFCSGADLSQILNGSLKGERFQSVTNKIASLSIPTIAAVNGNVFGGGMELVLSCDFRLGREGLLMRIPAGALGLCYPVEGIQRLTRRLGVNLAKRVLVGAETFTAEQALSLGMIESLYPAETLSSAVRSYAESLLALAPMAMNAMLVIIRQLEIGAYDPVEAEALSEKCAKSDDIKEGIRALKEKRAPIFKGC